MLVVPYLVLFFIALGLQIAFYMKKDIRLCTAGHIAGVVCGLYITFIIWLYAGFGKDSSYAAFVIIKGFPMYMGTWSILPAAVFALILTPLLCWAPRWVAYMLTHFIDDGAAAILPETQILTGFTRAFCTLTIVFMYFCIGFIPLFLMLDEAQYSHSVIAYLNNNYILLSFGGLIQAIWALVGIRYAVNVIVAKLYGNRKG